MPRVAVRVTFWGEVTAEVPMVNVAVVAPPATVTEAGIETLFELLESTTAMPVAGAAVLIVTVPVADAVPITEVGCTVS